MSFKGEITPAFTAREQRLILLLRTYAKDFSYRDIAEELNYLLHSENNGCRTRDGIYQFLAKERKDLLISLNNL